MKRPVAQDNPICEGSGIEPLIDHGLYFTDDECGATVCPMCGITISVTRREGRIRKHRRKW